MNKVAVQPKTVAPIAQEIKTTYRSASSTVEVEVKDDQSTLVATQKSQTPKTKNNTAVITVLPCDQIARNTEKLSSDLTDPKLDQKLKSNTSKSFDFQSLGEKLFVSGTTKNVKVPLMGKIKNIRQLKKIQKKAKKGSELDSLFYTILVILLILLLLRLILSALAIPLVDLLLLILVIFIIGRLLGLW
jgi:hypothetical protein